MDKTRRDNIAVVVSIFAIFLSGLSLWQSYENRQHYRLVEWEQKRQEARRLLYESESLLIQLAEVSRQQIRSNKDANLRETAALEWGAIEEFRERTRKISAKLESFPLNPKIDGRVMLELVVAETHLLNKDLRAELKRSNNLVKSVNLESDE